MFEFCVAFRSPRLGTHYYNVIAPNKQLAVGVAAARMTRDNQRFFNDKSLRIARPKLVKCQLRVFDLTTLFS